MKFLLEKQNTFQKETRSPPPSTPEGNRIIGTLFAKIRIMARWVYMFIGSVATTTLLYVVKPDQWAIGFFAALISMFCWSRHGWHLYARMLEEALGKAERSEAEPCEIPDD